MNFIRIMGFLFLGFTVANPLTAFALPEGDVGFAKILYDRRLSIRKENARLFFERAKKQIETKGLAVLRPKTTNESDSSSFKAYKLVRVLAVAEPLVDQGESSSKGEYFFRKISVKIETIDGIKLEASLQDLLLLSEKQPLEVEVIEEVGFFVDTMNAAKLQTDYVVIRDSLSPAIYTIESVYDGIDFNDIKICYVSLNPNGKSDTREFVISQPRHLKLVKKRN